MNFAIHCNILKNFITVHILRLSSEGSSTETMEYFNLATVDITFPSKIVSELELHDDLSLKTMYQVLLWPFKSVESFILAPECRDTVLESRTYVRTYVRMSSKVLMQNPCRQTDQPHPRKTRTQQPAAGSIYEGLSTAPE